ncbi:MAG TPA: DUF721 domain-containing protein [Terriglobales bacterium]|jgi:predicted nucleic acid-binding Zn ribbon protein
MQQASSGLEKIVVDSVRRSPAQDMPALAWPIVCGSAVADRTRALDFTDGILRVEVADKGWRTELQALAPQYMAVLNRYTGNRVQRIEFVVRQA